MTDVVVNFMGVRYRVPEVTETGRLVLAVNIGGAVVPAALAGYLIARDDLAWRALLVVVIVTVTSLLDRLLAGARTGVT